MLILHFYMKEKFTVDYVKKINQLFPQEEHVFYIYNNSSTVFAKEDLPFQNVYFGEVDEANKDTVTELFQKADRVILHSLFISYQGKRILLALMKKYPKPVIWAVWGGDLYDAYREYHNSLNPGNILRESIRKQIISRLYGAVAEEDYAVLRKLYKTDAKQFIATYTYNFIDQESYEKTDDYMNIMVGHSATENCRHLDVFEALKMYRGKIRVYCPLSYPADQPYIDMVAAKGKELFGDDFYPMTDFMAYTDYVHFLNRMDIGIFNNDRQQGNGNIVNLLYLGKKLYLSPENNLLRVYRNRGAVMNEFSEVTADDFLQPYTKEIQENNHKVVTDRYSDESFHKDWEHIFKG